MHEVRDCVFCGSINHIPIYGGFPAWECWNCLNKHWLDDSDKDGYDNYDLLNDVVPVLYGQMDDTLNM